jgi:hypothetical protein
MTAFRIQRAAQRRRDLRKRRRKVSVCRWAVPTRRPARHLPPAKKPQRRGRALGQGAPAMSPRSVALDPGSAVALGADEFQFFGAKTTLSIARSASLTASALAWPPLNENDHSKADVRCLERQCIRHRDISTRPQLPCFSASLGPLRPGRLRRACPRSVKAFPSGLRSCRRSGRPKERRSLTVWRSAVPKSWLRRYPGWRRKTLLCPWSSADHWVSIPAFWAPSGAFVWPASPHAS